jgi:hypothetical protein
MKKGLALLVIAPLLVITFAPAFCQNTGEAWGQNSCDDCNHVFALTSPFIHLDHDHKWISISYSQKLSYRLPQTLPSSAETRAPPA